MENHDYLWTTEKNNWVLVNTEYGYGIINRKEQTMLMVSDPELKQSLIDKMKSEGCKTFSSLEEAYKDAE
ncbi:MAG: hypothetical protein II167_03560 [Clostridiales bacterium]|nr:hypothetical protein [Clostridiales bacterium]